ncbi:hypothetical protein O4546_08560 [Salinivibrio kushneri]|nr:hypothetical protein [Salinivibrio kushneri]WBA10878.1 hypothetical protein O4546_08560 [Salinivibrio kushneri]
MKASTGTLPVSEKDLVFIAQGKASKIPKEKAKNFIRLLLRLPLNTVIKGAKRKAALCVKPDIRNTMNVFFVLPSLNIMDQEYNNITEDRNCLNMLLNPITVGKNNKNK